MYELELNNTQTADLVWNFFILKTFGKEDQDQDYAHSLTTGDFTNILAPEKLFNPFKLMLSILAALNFFLLRIWLWIQYDYTDGLIRSIYCVILILAMLSPTNLISVVIMNFSYLLLMVATAKGSTLGLILKMANPFHEIINPLSKWITEKTSWSRNTSVALSLCCAIMLCLTVCILAVLPSYISFIGCLATVLIIAIAHSWQTCLQAIKALCMLIIAMTLSIFFQTYILQCMGNFLLFGLKIFTLNSNMLERLGLGSLAGLLKDISSFIFSFLISVLAADSANTLLYNIRKIIKIAYSSIINFNICFFLPVYIMENYDWKFAKFVLFSYPDYTLAESMCCFLTSLSVPDSANPSLENIINKGLSYQYILIAYLLLAEYILPIKSYSTDLAKLQAILDDSTSNLPRIRNEALFEVLFPQYPSTSDNSEQSEQEGDQLQPTPF